MYATNGNASRVRWQVLWISKGKVQCKDFEHDLASALDLYVKVKGARSGATLRSCNMGFPPPDKYADWETERFQIVERKVPVTVNGKRRVKWKKFKQPLPDQLIEPRSYRDRMHAMNVKGWWWCPYCLSMRQFRKRNFFKLEGIRVDEASMNCPICDISHRDASVQKYNPIADRYVNMRRTRSDKGVSRG